MDVRSIPLHELEAWVRDALGEERRVLLGITGAPGVGKSTVASGLSETFAAPIVGMDGFHLALEVVEREGWVDRKGAPFTFDAFGFVAFLERLARQGPDETVYAPRYDRAARNPVGSAVPIEPSDRLVLIEGNYLLLDEHPWSEVRDILGSCIYLETDDEVRVERLVARHIAFGKDPDHARRFVL